MHDPIELVHAKPTTGRGLAAALIGLILIAGLGWSLLSPGPAPVRWSDYAPQKVELDQHMDFARGYVDALMEIQGERAKATRAAQPDSAAQVEQWDQARADLDAAMLAQNQPAVQAHVAALAKSVKAREAWHASVARSAVLAIGAGLAGGVALWLLLGTRLIPVRVDDVAVWFDGHRVPLADLRRVTRRGRRLLVEWDGGSLRLVARVGRLVDLFRLEGLLQQRVPSAEVQAEERAARDEVQAAHARMMEQLERSRRASRGQRAET